MQNSSEGWRRATSISRQHSSSSSMQRMPDESDDLEEGSLSTVSVLSLEESIHVAAALSGITPVKTRADSIDLKLDNIQKKLNELHNKRNENWEIEMEWEKKEAEIFSTAESGVRKGSRKERKMLERQDFLKKLAQPKTGRGRVKTVTDGISVNYHAQVVRNALDKPGIGEYNTFNGSLDQRGGRFSTANPKSDVDWKILRAQENLMSYVKLPSTLISSGGTFNKSSKPLTEQDWQVKRAKEVPGPGKYDTRPLADKLGHQRGKFSVAKPKTDVEWMVHRGLENPGSHILLPSTLKTSGGAFNQSEKPWTEQDWKVKRASVVPAPGDYTLSSLRAATGGKFNTGNSKNDVEWKIYNSRHTPGPGGYDVSQAMDASSEHVKAGNGGKFNMVYRPLQEAHAHLAKGTAKAEEAAAVRRHTVSLSPLEIRRASISLFEGDGVEAAQRAERRHTIGAPARGLVLWKQAQKLLNFESPKEGGTPKGGSPIEGTPTGSFSSGRGVSFWGVRAEERGGGGAGGSLRGMARRSGGMTSSMFGVVMNSMQNDLAQGEELEQGDDNGDEDDDDKGKEDGHPKRLINPPLTPMPIEQSFLT